ncbi:MAG TPA: SHOCT domain-containing protein [Rubrobacter sp.]|nr:SHOCT domain-containing protein [Rubrobacter sp.]
MMGAWDGGMMGTFGWLWMLIPLLFWGGLLVLIAWAVVRIFPGGQAGGVSHAGSAPSAEDILRERFAQGEIDAEEYEERLRVLRGGT